MSHTHLVIAETKPSDALFMIPLAAFRQIDPWDQAFNLPGRRAPDEEREQREGHRREPEEDVQREEQPDDEQRAVRFRPRWRGTATCFF